MKKEKVAFVVVRYGKNINGGAEYHCQMLAERLVSDYDVEVLTTCVRDVATGENIYPEGEEISVLSIKPFSSANVHISLM